MSNAVIKIEKKFNQPIETILADLIDQGEQVPGIAEALGIKKTLTYELLREVNLKPKSKFNSQSYFVDSQSEFAKLLGDFIMAKELEGKSPKTLKFYKTNLDRYIWWLNQNEIALNLRNCFTTEVIRQFLYYLSTTEVRFGGFSTASRKMVNRSTVDAYWRTLQAFSTWLILEGKLKESPIGYGRIKKIGKPKQRKVIIPEIPKEVIKSILNQCDDSLIGLRNKAIILILFDTGIRLSELVGIDQVSLNLDTGLIKVLGKGQKERIVRVSQWTLEAIYKYLAARKTVAKNGSFLIDDWGYSFGAEGVEQMLGRIAKQFPNVPLNPHSWRHTWALNFYRKTRDLLALRDLGGWEDLKMPEHYAAAITQEDALKAHEIGSPVDDLFNGVESRK